LIRRLIVGSKLEVLLVLLSEGQSVITQLGGLESSQGTQHIRLLKFISHTLQKPKKNLLSFFYNFFED